MDIRNKELWCIYNQDANVQVDPATWRAPVRGNLTLMQTCVCFWFGFFFKLMKRALTSDYLDYSGHEAY